MTTIIEAPLRPQGASVTTAHSVSYVHDPKMPIVEWYDERVLDPWGNPARLGFSRAVVASVLTSTSGMDRRATRTTKVRVYCRRLTAEDVFDPEHPEEIEVHLEDRDIRDVYRALGLSVSR